MSELIVREIAVQDADGAAVNVRLAGDVITVTWYCGDGRSFRPDDLPGVMNAVGTAADFPGVWMTMKDLHGHDFAVRVEEDGMLFADTRAVSGRDGRGVPWKDLRKALRKLTPKVEANQRDDMPAASEPAGAVAADAV